LLNVQNLNQIIVQDSLQAEPINLVYILGYGHSGSTLLDMMLGSTHDMLSCGELWAFGRNLHENRLCSCGKHFSECEFWHSVLKTLEEQVGWTPQQQHYSPSVLTDSTISKWLTRFRSDFRPSVSTRVLEQFGMREKILFQTLLEESGAKVAVDSSKYLERLIALHYTGHFNIRVIHLIRDGLALLDAARRALARTSANRSRPVITPLEILRWTTLINRQKRFLDEVMPDCHIRISYESLTSNPVETMTRAFKDLEIDFSAETLDDKSDQYVFQHERHFVGGNRMKYADASTSISKSGDWVSRISNSDRYWFKFLGGERLESQLR